MDKKSALVVLINHTNIFSEKTKQELVEKIPDMTDEDIDFLGRNLALEKKYALQNNEKILAKIDLILDHLKHTT